MPFRSSIFCNFSFHFFCQVIFFFGISVGTGQQSQAFTERRWYPASEADFFDYIIKGPFVNLNLGSQNQILNLNHPVTVYMQDWAATIDQVLRAENPGKFKGIPKPRIAVPTVPRMFSNTTTVPLCFNLKTEVQKPASSLKADNSVKIAITYSGSVAVYNRPCKQLAVSSEELESLISWSNRVHPSCPIDLKNNVLSIARCQTDRSAVSYSEVGGIVFQPMSPWILMDISKFMMGIEFTEEMFLSEMAHELAHFYQSHLSNSSENSTIFYKLAEREWNKVPRLNQELQTKWQLLPQATKNFEQKLSSGQSPSVEDVKLLGRAFEEKIGSFTLEDEAFFLQSYYLSRIGIDPKSGVKHLFEVWNYQKSRQQFYLPGEMSFGQCRKAYENGWMGAREPLFVAPANFIDYHHSFCFLIFEVDRGVQALGNEFLNHPRSTSKISWRQVQNEVQIFLKRAMGR